MKNIKRISISILAIMMILVEIVVIYKPINCFANEISKSLPYDGIPTVVLQLQDLNNTGELIYCGIDIGVFYDPERDGTFVIVPDDRKVKRIITRNTKFTLNLGSSKDYKKGVVHKLAMRTLYVPTGVKQEPIVIADQSNGKDGWIPIPGSEFIPTYFINRNSPYIRHTEKWDKNREEYNESKAVNFKVSEFRNESVFWSGEKFELHIETDEVVSKIKVTIEDVTKDNGDKYSVVLSEHIEHPTITGAAIYEGTLWDESMFYKWGNYVPKVLKFRMEILDDENKLLERRNTEIVVDNRDLFYRSRREY